MRLSQTDDPAAAAGAWAAVTDANPTSGAYFHELARARARADDVSGAVLAYERAIALGHAPAGDAYAIAVLRARAGDKEEAMHALTRAFDLGLRDLEALRADDAFAALHGDAHFLALAGIPAAPASSREEGLRFDLKLLSREAHRRAVPPLHGVPPSPAFDAALASLERRGAELSDGEVVVEIAKLLRMLGSGHTGVLGVRIREAAWALPLRFFFFEEGLYVVAADPALRDLVGARVERIGGHTIDSVRAALDPLIPRDNEMWPRAIGPYRMRSTALLHALGLLPDARRAMLDVFDAAGRAREVTVEADTRNPDIWNTLPYPAGWVGLEDALGVAPALGARDNGVAHWLAYDAASSLIYVAYNKVADADPPGETLEAFAARLEAELAAHDVRKLVIDLRQNNGGNTFLDEPLLHTLMRTKGLDQRGRFFVLIGRRTFSAAMNAAAYFERHLHPIFVGEPTGGSPNSVGDEMPFTLPHCNVVVNVADTYWEGSWPYDRRPWIAPEIYAPPTFAAVRAGRDPAMDAVIAFGR
jgi:hypothetical protein